MNKRLAHFEYIRLYASARYCIVFQELGGCNFSFIAREPLASARVLCKYLTHRRIALVLQSRIHHFHVQDFIQTHTNRVS